jgi:hypothetical protein
MMARLEANIEASNEKFEALGNTLLSWMETHQARLEFTQEEMKARWTYIKKRWIPG